MASMSNTNTNGKIENAADAARDALNTTRESFSDASDAVRKAAPGLGTIAGHRGAHYQQQES